MQLTFLIGHTLQVEDFFFKMDELYEEMICQNELKGVLYKLSYHSLEHTVVVMVC